MNAINEKFQFHSNLNKDFSYIGSKEFSEDSILLLGLPTDSSTCFRPGARFGPSELRKFSDNLETFSMYQERDLENISYCDLGDLALPRTNNAQAYEIIRDTADEIYQKQHRVIFLGGDHSISYPILTAVEKYYKDLAILHFDAHADLRTEYEGEKYSHACSMGNSMALFKDKEKRLFQFGIRSATKEEYDQMKSRQTGKKISDLKQLALDLAHRPIYISFDLDIFDPGIMPGTGTPEAGGWSFQDFLNCLPALDRLNIIGADIVELSPVYDPSGISAALASKVVREILLLF